MRMVQALVQAVLGALLPMYAFAQPAAPATVQTPIEIHEGLPEHLIYLYSGTNSTPSSAAGQIYAGSRRWEPGRTLKVCLFNGNDTVARLIRDAASEWNRYASVRRDFGPPDRWYNCLSPQIGFAQIRVGFSGQGFWSVVGNDSETRLESWSPSMNLQGFNRLYSPDRMPPQEAIQRARPYHVATIKHEFGHALGLLHEHQHPSLKCQDQLKLTGPNNVYEYFGKPENNWTADEVKRNLGFIGQTDPDYVKGAPDLKSIMMYSIPEDVFKLGKQSPCFVPTNYEISEKDKQVIARIYPKVLAAGPTTPANVPIDADLQSAKVRPLAALPAPAEVDQIVERILIDLESDDVFTRRDARARLANVIGGVNPQQAAAIIKDSTKSYRSELGVAFAIAKSPLPLKLNAEAKSFLSSRASATQDPTLRAQLRSASNR